MTILQSLESTCFHERSDKAAWSEPRHLTRFFLIANDTILVRYLSRVMRLIDLNSPAFKT